MLMLFITIETDLDLYFKSSSTFICETIDISGSWTCVLKAYLEGWKMQPQLLPRHQPTALPHIQSPILQTALQPLVSQKALDIQTSFAYSRHLGQDAAAFLEWLFATLYYSEGL